MLPVLFWKSIAPGLMLIAVAALAFWLSRRMGASGFPAAVLVVLFSVGSPQASVHMLAMGALAVFLPAWDEAVQGEWPTWWRLAFSAGLCGLWVQGWYVALALVVSLAYLMRRRAVKPVAIFTVVYALVAWVPQFVTGTAVARNLELDGVLFLMPFFLPLAARFSGRRWVETSMLPYWLVAYSLWFAGWHLHQGAVLMAVLFVSIGEAGGRQLERA